IAVHVRVGRDREAPSTRRGNGELKVGVNNDDRGDQIPPWNRQPVEESLVTADQLIAEMLDCCGETSAEVVAFGEALPAQLHRCEVLRSDQDDAKRVEEGLDLQERGES